MLELPLLTDLVWTSRHWVIKLAPEFGVTVPISRWLQSEGLWPQFLDLLPGDEQRFPQHASAAAPAPLQGAVRPCLHHHSPPTQALHSGLAATGWWVVCAQAVKADVAELLAVMLISCEVTNHESESAHVLVM